MKKGIIYLLIILSCFFISNNFVLADSQEIIRDFKSNILVKENSDVEIQETIFYDFGSNQKHGVIRFIPFRYPLEDKTLVLNYQVLSVQDTENKSIKYEVYEEGNDFAIKIGSSNELVSGQKIYIIKYILQGAINYFNDHDELFWNVTGNNWQIPIEHSEAHFALDNFFAEASLDNFQTICYTGILDSKEQNCQIDKALSARVISFESSNLNPKEGLTIVVSWPKGFTQEVEKKYIETIGIFDLHKKFLSVLKNEEQYIETTEGGLASLGEKNLFIRFLFTFLSVLYYSIALISLIIMILVFSLWWKKGIKLMTRRSIVAEYEAPENITLPEAHIIINEGSVELGKMATATLIDLARRGYFIIREGQKKVLFFKSTDWKFIKTDKYRPEDTLNEYEKYLLDNIFEGKNEVFLSNLKHPLSASKRVKIKKDLEQAQIDLEDRMINKKLISVNIFSANKKAKAFLGKAIIFLSVLSFLIAIILIAIDIPYKELSKIFIILLIAIIEYRFILTYLTSFANVKPFLTEEGIIIKDKLRGFNLFLKMVERDRVKFHFSPEAHPEKFAEYLPYAILFGVEKQWAKLFKDINAAIPEWYQGQQGASLNSVVIASSIKNMNSNINSSFIAAGSAAASGKSGFSSSGGSGGGFGGGGGSSW